MGNVYMVIHRHNELAYAAKKIEKSILVDVEARLGTMTPKSYKSRVRPCSKSHINNLDGASQYC